MSATTWGWLVLAAPLAGTVLVGALFNRLPGRSAGWIATASIALSFVFALLTFVKLQSAAPGSRELTSTLWTIAGTVGVDAKATILVDPLSVLMILVVAGVSTLIHLYSISYLSGDRGYSRFFAYLNFFVFSMLLLVLAGNFVLLIVGWAFVGAASYMLISFWYRRTTATSAGIKAFVINVLGDIGLVLGTFFIFRHTGTLDLLASFHRAPTVFAAGSGDVTAGCLLLLVGAFAKSAQIPLHTWLPDAMEGPTPVSALIHAATMVTAGVYLIARMHPLFQLAPAAGDVGAIVGAATLLIAGTIGLAQTDLKRVIAYSTMSQIGYMIMGVSAGAYAAGLFHLMTHAFFKALLFMAAGSVIAAMGGSQSLERMSGLRRALPFTFACFVIGGLALTGVPPFSGFFSKDGILLYIAGRGGWHWALYVAGYLGAFLTGLYTFRMIFRAFLGEPCPEALELIEHGHLFHAEVPTNPANGEVEDTDVGFPGPEHHIAERALPMRAAMSLLALLAVVGGIVSIPKTTSWLDHFLTPTFADSTIVSNPSNGLLAFGLILGAVISVASIATAYWIWVLRPGMATQIASRVPRLADLFENKWYFDELIDSLVVQPGAWFGRFAQNTFERIVVNGTLIGGTTGLVRAGSALVRAAQSGILRLYAGLMLVGIAAVGLYFLLQSSDALMLSILIWLPAAAALIGATAGGRRLPGLVALAGSLGSLGLAIALIVGYSGSAGEVTHVIDVVWIRSLGIHYKLGVDGLNLFLVTMTTFVFSMSLLAANLRSWPKPEMFYLLLGIAQSAVLGAFLAQDLALFVGFFDLMLIPFYLLTGIYGGPGRVAATTKLVIYTFVGSLLMLAGAIALAVLTSQQTGQPLDFTYTALAASPIGKGSQEWIFLLFAAAFLVKMPAFPLHGWMPDGYREMPIEVLAIFSGVLSKVGAYGFLAIVLPLMPDASAHFQTLLLVIGLASIIYGSAMAFTQTNARLILGYSSVAQLGFITMGIFALAPKGAQGALLQMVNHGIVVAPAFFIVALLAARAGGSEDIRDMGGIAMRAPILATIFLIVAFATLAIPGSGNFIGEVLILLGLFQTKTVFSIIAFTGVLMASIYMLRLFIRTMHNRAGPEVASRELRWRDALVLVPFIGVIALFAIYPQIELSRAEQTVTGQIAAAATAASTPASASTTAP